MLQKKICLFFSDLVGTMAAYIPKLRRLESGKVVGLALFLIKCALKDSMEKSFKVQFYFYPSNSSSN